MKRNIVLLLVISLVFSLLGCNHSSDKDFIEPVAFYYCTEFGTNENFDDVFMTEIHEGSNYAGDRIALLNRYLAGPYTDGSVSPFPVGLSIISLKTDQETICIVLSDQITELQGLSLTLACACLSQTIFELYSCDCVEISVSNGTLDGSESIRIYKDDLLFADSTYTVAED